MHKPTFQTHEFIAALQPHADKHLVFEYEGRRIQPGYHVTEIKAASFRSLDCGARPQQWNETIVQLWDVADKPEQGHMSVRKFLGIWKKVDERVGLDPQAEIKFEWGDAVAPAVFYTFDALREADDSIIIAVESVRATCKPRDEWWLMEKITEQASACCTSTASLPDDTVPIIQIASIGTSPVTMQTTMDSAVRRATNTSVTCCS
jgi:hypothetical protein